VDRSGKKRVVSFGGKDFCFLKNRLREATTGTNQGKQGAKDEQKEAG